MLFKDLRQKLYQSFSTKRIPFTSYPQALRAWGGDEKELLKILTPRCILFLLMGLSFALALWLGGYRILAIVVIIPAILGALESLWRRKVIKERRFISFRDYLLSFVGLQGKTQDPKGAKMSEKDAKDARGPKKLKGDAGGPRKIKGDVRGLKGDFRGLKGDFRGPEGKDGKEKLSL
jgi:hypothetical protein